MTRSAHDRDRRDAAIDRTLRSGDSLLDEPDDACPDAETLAAHYERTLTLVESARVQMHVASCDRCRARLAMVAASELDDEVEPGVPWRSRWKLLVPVAATVAAGAMLWVAVDPTRDLGRESQPTVVERTDELARQTRSTDEPLDRAQAEADAEAEQPRATAPFAPAAELESPREADLAPERPADTTAAQASTPEMETRREGVAIAGRSPMVTVVSRANPQTRWRLGPAGSVARSTDGGASWIQLSERAPGVLGAGSSPSSEVLWAVGPEGLVVRSTDGAGLNAIASPTDADLTSVDALDADAATITAADGRRYSTADGGRLWRPVP